MDQGASFGIVSRRPLKTRFFGFNSYVSLGCNTQKYYLPNQTKLWNMLQAAFDHEKSFFDIPQAWNAAFQWVVEVISLEIWHFSKNVQNKFWPMLKYQVFYAEFESDIRFVWNLVKCHFLKMLILTLFNNFCIFQFLGSAAWGFSLLDNIC